MSKKLRKPLSWLLTFCMLISLFCGMVPIASAAVFNATVYKTEGISIGLEKSYGATNAKTVYFTVIVDNETVVDSKQVNGVPSDNVDLIINAEGYTVTFPTTEGCSITAKGSNWLLDLRQVVADSFSVTINLASEKKSDAIAITNGSIDYGTFHWQKNEASNTAFQRQVTVYVNDEEKYTQTVNTPKDLTNAGANPQYWFTPNTQEFKSDYEMKPPYTLNQATNKNLSIYLTTKCGCGRNTCLCNGGCQCPENCECDACMGETLEATEFDTGFGILGYKTLGLGGGYNLTVEVYVNGQKEYTSEQLRVRSGENGCLTFKPADGYYYHYENGYDIDTKNSGSSWVQSTGFLSIVGMLQEDRDYPNVLKIYLWTFDNGVQLDVERESGAPMNNVTGYIISYDAFNPKTNQNETYTYEATSFLAAQAQRIPTGTPVTLTAICADGKEVTRWYTSFAPDSAEFKGIKGYNYGNVAYLTVNATALTTVLVRIKEVGNVAPPTDEQLKAALNQKIQVKCSADENHGEKPYDLLIDSITVRPDQVTGNALNKYAYTITIKSDSYVDQYDAAIGAIHEPESDTKQVTLEYDGKDWTVQNGDSPVSFEVECDTNPDLDKPNAPDVETLKKLLAGKISVSCITASTAHPSETFGWMENGCLLPTSGVTGNATDGWEYVITINDSFYVNYYNNIKLQLPEGTHSPNKDTDPTITLKWTGNGWLCKETVALEAVCSLYTLTYDANGGMGGPGTVLVAPSEAGNYTLSDAVPSYAGYTFKGWTTDSNADGKTYGTEDTLPRIETAVDVPETGLTVYAVWQEEEPTTERVSITFNSGKHGDFGWYYHNSKDVELTKGGSLTDAQIPTVYPDSGYKFIGWYKQGSASWELYSDEALLKMEFNSDATFIAQYKRTGGSGVDVDDDEGGGTIVTTKYEINASAGNGGDISPKGTVKVNRGAEKLFIITADKGYKISDVLVDGESVGKVSSYTFKNVQGDHTIKAIFAKLPTDPDDSGTSNWLNTKDHFAYMNGYPDSTFGPNRNMTRAEVAQMFYALLLDKDVTTTVAFSDVPADAWYAKAVNTLASLGMVTGYPDGTFHPDASITRAEFATIAMAFAYELKDADCNYYDVPENAWFYTYVAHATTYGWIGGSNGYFRPNDMITRAEVSVIVNNMLGRAADEDYVDKHEDDLVTFPDVKPSYWAYYSIMETVNDHEYTKDNGLEDWK